MQKSKKIETIREDVAAGLFFREHAIVKMAERNISKDEVVFVINNGEIIEESPQDKYGPTCLIFAVCDSRPIHVLVSCSLPIWVITVYLPDERKWINYKKRKMT